MNPLRLLVDMLVYSGVPPTNNPIDETRSVRKVEEKTVSQTIRAQQQVPPSTSNIAIPLAAATNDYLIIYCDQPITMTLNAIGTPIALNPQIAGVFCPVFVLRGSITSLSLSNAGTVAANVDVRSVKI